MGSILKTLFFILLALIILAVAIPLLWLVIKEANGLFGGMFTDIGSDLWYIVFTVICRFAVVRYLHNSGISDNSVYFVYERQVFSALDNFVLGMAAAAFWKQTGDRMQDYRLKLGLPVSIASTALILVWIFYYHSHGLYGTAPSGYPAHSILAILLSILLVGFSLLPEMDFRFLRPLYFVARNQYGIYLWHMPIIMILQANAPWFNTMSQQRFWLFLPCMVVITCVFGYFATRFIDHPASAKKKG